MLRRRLENGSVPFQPIGFWRRWGRLRGTFTLGNDVNEREFGSAAQHASGAIASMRKARINDILEASPSDAGLAETIRRPSVGVLTFHRCINYGSYWQARCLVEGLQALGCNAVLLDHDADEMRKAEFKCALQPLLPVRSEGSDVSDYARKTRRFLDAINRLPRSARFDLNRPVLDDAYDLVVVGSDEVWNLHHPWYGGAAAFFGHGLAGQRLVSYAASFGNQDAADRLPDEWARRLELFERISVRDANSRRVIRDALGLEPSLVLDPCLQFPPRIYFARDDEEPYILVYGHSFPGWFSHRVRDATRQHRLHLLSIGYRNDWADEQRIAAGPEEFARLMAGASAVVTNFFHGCVFAFLNTRPLVCVPSAYRNNKIRDLTSALAAERHLIDEDSAESRYFELIERQPEIASKLADLRRDSAAFLARALEGV